MVLDNAVYEKEKEFLMAAFNMPKRLEVFEALPLSTLQHLQRVVASRLPNVIKGYDRYLLQRMESVRNQNLGIDDVLPQDRETFAAMALRKDLNSAIAKKAPRSVGDDLPKETA
jgi:hypothetical protein